MLFVRGLIIYNEMTDSIYDEKLSLFADDEDESEVEDDDDEKDLDDDLEDDDDEEESDDGSSWSTKQTPPVKGGSWV